MRKILAIMHCIGVLGLFALAAGCTAPRSVINSGKVTAPGQFKAGINFGGNLASSPISQLGNISKAAVDAILKKDTAFYDNQIEAATRGLVAYTLDPVGPTFDFYVRYGLAKRVDLGYKYASGAHVLDAMYQFMGATGSVDNPEAAPGEWYGSVGLQYAGQQSGIIDKLFLNKLQPILDFRATRRDLMVPLIFSKSFGAEEEKGHIAFGAVYNHTFIKYGFEPNRLFRKYGDDVVKVGSIMETNSFPSFGVFLNGKIGYKFVYLLPAITVFYQNYGTYQFLENSQQSFSGFTLIPSIGIQAQFGKGRNR